MRYLRCYLTAAIVSGINYAVFRFLWSDVSDRVLLCLIGATIIGFIVYVKETSNE